MRVSRELQLTRISVFETRLFCFGRDFDLDCRRAPLEFFFNYAPQNGGMTRWLALTLSTSWGYQPI